MWRIATFARRFSVGAEITEKLKGVVTKIDAVKMENFTPEAKFADFGLDSLDSVEVVVCMEDVLQVELTDEEALKITSVPEAVEVFSKYYKPQT